MKKALVTLLLSISLFGNEIPLSHNDKCDLAIDKAGDMLLQLGDDELNKDISSIHTHYTLFIALNGEAIAACSTKSVNVSIDLLKVQENVTNYYNIKYK